MVECIAYCAVKTFLISVRLTRECEGRLLTDVYDVE